MKKPFTPACASSCLFHPVQRAGVIDGFLGVVSTAEVKGEGDVAGGGICRGGDDLREEPEGRVRSV